MPFMLRAQTPRITRLSSYPLGSLQLSQFAHDLGCVGFLVFRGGRPVLIGGGHSPLAPTNTPIITNTEEGVAYDLTAASSQSATASIAPQIGATANISLVARLKFRTLPVSAAGAIAWGNTSNSRGIGVGCDSSGHTLAFFAGAVSTQTVVGSTVYSTFVTVGATAAAAAAGVVSLYENGSLIGSCSTAGAGAAAFAAKLKLGQDFGAALSFFDGQIAWAALFNSNINAAQHAAIYTHPERLLTLKYPVLTGAVATVSGTVLSGYYYQQFVARAA